MSKRAIFDQEAPEILTTSVFSLFSQKMRMRVHASRIRSFQQLAEFIGSTGLNVRKETSDSVAILSCGMHVLVPATLLLILGKS